ncbi:MAG: SLC13 family permease, partial [Oscillospiraceae bacterium]
MSTTCIIILVSILVVIILGYTLKINYGLLGICFAFICGCLIAGYSPSKVMGMWGTKVFFQMFSIAFFYAFAINNGTMELLAKKLVYAARNTTFLIPLILFLVGAVLAGIGPGSISMFLILIPIIMQVAKETNMHPLLAAVVAVSGINAGAWSPICVNGITVLGLIEAAGYTAEEASHYSNVIFRNAIIVSFLFFVIAYVIFRGWKCTPAHTEKPDAFSKQQKTSLILIIIMTAILVLPSVLKNIFGGTALTWLAGKVDATFLAIIFGVISIILKVGDEKKAIASVPWKTIIMVCGMSMLISVASEAGATQFLSDYLGNSFSASALPYVMAIVAAVMSIFSSTM